MSNNAPAWPSENPPNLMLALDPGASTGKQRVPYAGAAFFQWGMLSWAGLVKAPVSETPGRRPAALVRGILEGTGLPVCKHDLGEQLELLVVEVPRIYTSMKSRPEDLMQLAVISGVLLGIPARRVSAPRPQEWKGTIDGGVFLKRVIGTWNPEASTWEGGILSTTEKGQLLRSPDCHTTHVQDAIALGCWASGRIIAGGISARNEMPKSLMMRP
jgi:hypothetical protein